MATNRLDLRAQLHPFGVRAADVVLLDSSATPANQVRYLDLMRPVDGLPWPQAIVEVDGQPALYVVDVSRTPTPPHTLASLRRSLFFRADADHVALIEPGKLTLYPVAPTAATAPPRMIRSDAADAPGLVQSLVAGDPGRSATAATAVHGLLKRLLTRTTDALARAGVDHLDALSLVGRALFVRFLADRRILREEDVAGCFADASAAAKICSRLDADYNGDFLPLPHGGSRRWFGGLDPVVFHELAKILHRAEPDGQLHFKCDEWHDLRFDRIPIGLLSQVYEYHAHRFEPQGARQTSVLYTPRHLAAYMIDEVFHALGDRAAGARVLDPSAGGGVFLVEVLRRLVAARWQVDGVRPDAAAIQRILYDQLQGFDISEPALRLCTLSLYLTAIELAPPGAPPARFERPLIGSVLRDVRSKNPAHTYLGSLGDERLGPEHLGRYDAVVGNPPWSAWESTGGEVETQVGIVLETLRPTLRARLGEQAAASYSMVDRVPDVPFVWRAMAWAKPDAQIAFVLHARVLFKQSAQGIASRNELMGALQITGLLNGTALRNSEFWPEVQAPFCLLFARNSAPAPESSFWFVSPDLELRLNDRGRWRIDDANARVVRQSEVVARPTLLKTLFRGNDLDAEVIRRVDRLPLVKLKDYWEQGGGEKHHGQGYKEGGSGPATRRKQIPAAELWGMRKLEGDRPLARCLDDLDLPTIARGAKYQHPRKRTIYSAPLTVVPETPSTEPGVPNAYLALRDIAYKQSFRGFSCAWHPEAELLARYLFLLFSSNLPVYFALLTSGKLGVERDIFEGSDLLGFRLYPLEALTEAARSQILPLSRALCDGERGAEEAVQTWAAALYGLNTWDGQVIRDTLAVSAPFASAKQCAQRRPTGQQVEAYVAAVEATARPFIGRHGRELKLSVLRDAPSEPWILLQLDAFDEGSPPPATVTSPQALLALIDAADSLAASRVLLHEPPSRILLAQVAEYRHFTPTRARLLGLELVHEHARTLLGTAST